MRRSFAPIALAILSQLFLLLEIDVLREVMKQGWFGWTFSALAFGAALGVLRNEIKVLDVMRTVVLLVLSLLAVPLAGGLVAFLLATAVSGPQVLWEATREATPTLLACAAGAFVLTCVIVRQDDEVHLSTYGASLVANEIIDALRRDGLTA